MRDLSHLHRQRQGVIGISEKAVFVHDHLVKENPRLGEIEPDRFGGAEEVDLVPSLRQLRTERSRKDAAPADERITSDADVERTRVFHPQKRRTEAGNSARL